MGRKRTRSGSYSDEDDGLSRQEKEELRDCWKAVDDDPHDFDAWTRLLQFVEQKDDSKTASEAFDSFLKRYPFCFGYWRKYAEVERRNHRYEKALNVYERGVKEIPLSVDLWLAYIQYIKDIGTGQKQAVSKTRAIYMRALDACGLDFRSDKLWREYIDWEISVNDYVRASQVFDILLGTPTMGYQSHFDSYKQFVERFEPDQILNPQEYESISDDVYRTVKDDLDGSPLFFEEVFEEDIPDDEQLDDGVTKRVIKQRKHIEVALNEFRREIIDRRKKLHRSNEAAVEARLKFENGIKRPYFHVKPLDRDQLLNWYNYLDFEINDSKKKRIQVLFDRCVIACAFYEEFWVKYAAYYDSINEVDKAREIYQKAVEVHCSRKPGIYLAYSAFEEKQGDLETALNILNDFDKRHSSYVAIKLRKINIERRIMAKKDKDPDYSNVIKKLEALMNESGNSRRVTSFYALKLARFLSKTCGDRRKAKDVIKDAIARDKDNLQLYMALVDIAMSTHHYRESEVLSAFDYAIESKYLSNEQRFLFSQRKLDFLEDMGSDGGLLQQHYIDHQKLEKQLDEPSTTLFSNLKRKATTPLGDELAEKRPYSGTGDNGMSQYNASPSVAWNMPPPMNQQMAQSPYMI